MGDKYHDCVVTKLKGDISALNRRCLEEFINWISDDRRQVIKNTKHAKLANSCKIIGNSSFCPSVKNKNNHKMLNIMINIHLICSNIQMTL